MGKKNDPPDELAILQQKIARDAFFERHFYRIVYGNLKYAPARLIVKGVNYGNADMPRRGLRIKNLSEVKEK